MSGRGEGLFAVKSEVQSWWKIEIISEINKGTINFNNSINKYFFL